MNMDELKNQLNSLPEPGFLGTRRPIAPLEVQAGEIQEGDVIWDVPSTNSRWSPGWRRVTGVRPWCAVAQGDGTPYVEFTFDDGHKSSQRSYAPVTVQVMA